MAWKLNTREVESTDFFAINYSAENVTAGEIAIVSIFTFI